VGYFSGEPWFNDVPLIGNKPVRPEALDRVNKWRHQWHWGVLFSAAVILSGCTAPLGTVQASSTATSPPPDANDGSPLLLSARIIPIDQAAVTTMKGSITLDGGCITLALGEGTSVPVVWPEYGQVESSVPIELVWPNGRLQVGQDLPSFDGFYENAAALEDDVKDIYGCVDSPETDVLVVTGVQGLILQQ
jgi:hypothetical protein